MPPDRLRQRTRSSPAARIIRGEGILRGEPADAFGEVAVGVGIAGNEVAQRRQHAEGVGLVKPIQHRQDTRLNSRQRKRPPGFSTRRASASAASMWVTLRMPKAMVIGVDRGIGDRQALGVAAHPGEAGEQAAVDDRDRVRPRASPG